MMFVNTLGASADMSGIDPYLGGATQTADVDATCVAAKVCKHKWQADLDFIEVGFPLSVLANDFRIQKKSTILV
ncbi:hypothetical protein ACH5RR_003528 [Cinchona calisaya]|uniref:Uncharacterized protein n=1 Tax=Cinchona calisaya TaxID=153742 RepID=A0ABD3AV20_9GENT